MFVYVEANFKIALKMEFLWHYIFTNADHATYLTCKNFSTLRKYYIRAASSIFGETQAPSPLPRGLFSNSQKKLETINEYTNM